MKFSKSIWMPLSFLALAALSGCAHAPVQEGPEPSIEELTRDLKDAIVKDLDSRGDVREIQNVEILRVEEDQEGRNRFTYRVAFVSKSPEYGLVSHGSQAVATLDRKARTQWTVSKVEPTSQSLIFHK